MAEALPRKTPLWCRLMGHSGAAWKDAGVAAGRRFIAYTCKTCGRTWSEDA